MEHFCYPKSSLLLLCRESPPWTQAITDLLSVILDCFPLLEFRLCELHRMDPSTWLLALCITFLRFIRVVLPFQCWLVFRPKDVPQFVDLFTSWWTLVPVFDCHEWSCWLYSCAVFVYTFLLFVGKTPRRELFSFYKKRPGFSKAAVLFGIRTSNAWEFPFCNLISTWYPQTPFIVHQLKRK